MSICTISPFLILCFFCKCFSWMEKTLTSINSYNLFAERFKHILITDVNLRLKSKGYLILNVTNSFSKFRISSNDILSYSISYSTLLKSNSTLFFHIRFGPGKYCHIISAITFYAFVNQPHINVFFLSVHSEFLAAIKPVSVTMITFSF